MSVDYLVKTIGPRITAVGLGVSHANDCEGADAQRVAVLTEAVEDIEAAYSADTAALFLTSANPDLGDHPPLLAVASGDYTGVRRAVQAFLI